MIIFLFFFKKSVVFLKFLCYNEFAVEEKPLNRKKNEIKKLKFSQKRLVKTKKILYNEIVL